MPKKQSSSRLSTIGGRIMQMTDDEIFEIVCMASNAKLHQFCDDIRSLGAAVVSLDETKGQER
jgi:hypothetical protein